MSIDLRVGDDAFSYPKPSPSSRHWGDRCPRAARATGVTRDGRVYECESGLEYRQVNGFLSRADVESIREQPPELRFMWADGSPGRHTVDLLVRLRSGATYAVLIKPTSRVEASRVEEIRDLLAAQAPRSFADYWVVVDERDVPRHVVANGVLIEDVRLHGPAPDDPLVSRVAGIVTRRMTVAAAAQMVGGGGDAFRALVRLLADGRLRLCHGVRIGMAALVEPGTGTGEARR